MPTDPLLQPFADVKALPAPGDANPSAEVAVATPPSRQLSELPQDELAHLAEELGLDPTRYSSTQALVAAVHQRRQLIAALDREALLDVVRWGRRPITANASREQMAQEIARIRTMRFAGLSQRGLVALARLRGLDVTEADPIPLVLKRLKKQEGIFARMGRRRRSLLGGLVARVLGEDRSGDYRYIPPPPGADDRTSATHSASHSRSIKDDIEEGGLFSGLSNRLKKSADQYLNQKLDEIEARIDRKLDEIDRKLADWRDKEIANRIRILKITLWASVIVGICSLIYSYVTVDLMRHL